MTGAPSTSLGGTTDAVNDPSQVSTDGGPAVLGAAATLPDQQRRRRPSRRERRAMRRGRRGAAGHAPGVTRRGAQADGPGYSDIEYVFEAGAATSTPLLPYVKSVWERRRFMLELARAGVRGKQSSTILGHIWGVVDPLFQALLYYLLFTIIRKGGRPIDFLPVLIAGFFLFGLAASALSEGGRSIRGSKSFMLNSTFPRAIFPITSMYTAVLRFAPAIFVYAAFHIVLGAPTGPQLLLLPVLFAIQLVMMLGLALLMSATVALFADAGNAIQYVTRILFFTTPVIFPLAAIPAGIRSTLEWQPFFPLFRVLPGGLRGRSARARSDPVRGALGHVLPGHRDAGVPAPRTRTRHAALSTRVRRFVLIGGVGRSGTSLLRRIVGSHSRIAIPPSESKFFSQYRLGRTVGEILTNERLKQWDLDLRPLYGLSHPDAFRSALAMYAESRGKEIPGEKSPLNEFHYDLVQHWLQDYYDIRFLQLVRNPLDVIASHKHAAVSRRRPGSGARCPVGMPALAAVRLARTCEGLR